MLLHRKNYAIATLRLTTHYKAAFYITPANGKIGHFTHLPHSFLDEKWLYGG